MEIDLRLIQKFHSNIPFRLIARLDLKGFNLIKGVNFEGLRVLGDPIDFALKYYQEGIDEIFLYDSVASLYGRNSLDQLISDICRRVFVPVTVSGGIRTLSDIKRVLDAGADKVCLNTAALKNPDFIDQAVNKYGSSTILVAIDYVKDLDGIYKCLVENGREITNINAIDWAIEVERRGVGEIILTSIKHEGLMQGLDIEFIKNLASKVNIPITIHGGIGNANHIKSLLGVKNVSGISMASLLHYNYLTSISDTEKKTEGNNSFVSQKVNVARYFDEGILESTSIKIIKSSLNFDGVLIRND